MDPFPLNSSHRNSLYSGVVPYSESYDIPSTSMLTSRSCVYSSKKSVNTLPLEDTAPVTRPNIRRHSLGSDYIPSPDSSLRPTYHTWTVRQKRERGSVSPPPHLLSNPSASSNTPTIRFIKTNKKKSELSTQGSYICRTETNIQYSVSSNMYGSLTFPINLSQGDQRVSPESPEPE